MDDDAIRGIVARLEEAAPLGGAKIRITQHGGGPDESYIVANRAGYLRLAALFLQATVSPLDAERPEVLSIDAEGLFDENSDVFLNWFERREDWTQDSPYDSSSRSSDWPCFLGCAVGALLIAMVFVAGVISIFKQIFP